MDLPPRTEGAVNWASVSIFHQYMRLTFRKQNLFILLLILFLMLILSKPHARTYYWPVNRNITSQAYDLSDRNYTSPDFQSTELPLNITSKNTWATNSSDLRCPVVPPNLVGVIPVNISEIPLENLKGLYPELEAGGHFRPKNCTARYRVAVLVPYRDRAINLPIFIRHMHPFLQKQQLDYTIFIVEQTVEGKFNRAKLMNVGALEALKLYQFDCFILHDVDLLPEDDRNLYTCPDQPRHLSIAINILAYKLPYDKNFGGVTSITVDQFKKINGLSNQFWGWGGEDDDFYNRIIYHGFFVSRYPSKIGRYTSLRHGIAPKNPARYQDIDIGKTRFQSDGLNNINYKIIHVQQLELYTWILVDIVPTL